MFRILVSVLLFTAVLGNPLKELMAPITQLTVKMTTELEGVKGELMELSSRVSMNEENIEKQKDDREIRDEEVDAKLQKLAKTLEMQSKSLLGVLTERTKELTLGMAGQLEVMQKSIRNNSERIDYLEGGNQIGGEYEMDGYQKVGGYSGLDLEELRQELSAEVDDKIQRLAAMIAELGQKVASMGSGKGGMKGFTCDVEYDGKCFMVVLAQLTVDQARFRCKEMGAELGNIYSKSQYDDIMKTTREMITYHTQMYTGMTYSQTTKKAYLRDGAAAPYLRWHQWFPNSSGTWIGFAVDPKNPTSEHMTNFTPPHTGNGCICEAAAR